MSERRLFRLDAPLPGLGRILSKEEAEHTNNYLNILTKWQKTHRLVGSTDPQWMMHNIIGDSVLFLGAVPEETRTLADAGSGAGIPGIPISIVRRDLRITLIESRQRRVSFLSTVVRELRLDHVEVVGDRLEQLGDSHADRFDVVVSRCAGSAAAVIPQIRPLVRRGGVIIVSASSTAPAMPGGEQLALRTQDGGVRMFHRYRRD